MEVSNMSIKVSVIVPVYNVEEYVRECIQSVLNQSLKEIEVIIVNDGSTDNSINCIEDFIKIDNVKLINQNNQGLSVARNTGIDVAQGEYILFVDSDDYIESEFIEKLYSEAKIYDLDIAISSHSKLLKEIKEAQKRDNSLITDKPISGCEFMYKQLKLKDKKNEVWDDLFKRKFLQDNNIKFLPGILYEDTLFTPKTLIYANKVKYIESYGYIYRQRGNSITKSEIGEKNINNLITIIEKLIELYRELSDNFQKKVLRKYLYNALVNILSYIDIYKVKDKRYLYKKIPKDSILNIMKEGFDNGEERIKYLIFKINLRLYMKLVNLKSCI